MTMPVYRMQGPRSLRAIIRHEDDSALLLSRRKVTVLAGSGADRAVLMGAVVGARLFGAPTIANAPGNTGGGGLGSLTYGDAVKVGTYACICIAEATDGGIFQVIDPDGYRLADATVGEAYASPQIAFTISDSGTDFAIGDTITVEVAAGDGKVTAIDPAATDGRQLAYGILVDDVTAPDGVDMDAVAVVRRAVVAPAKLVWPDGYSEAAKAAALARLEKAGIDTVDIVG